MSAAVQQVTASSVRLINVETTSVTHEWHPPSKKNISVVAANGRQLLCAVSSEVYYIEVEDTEIKQVRCVCLFQSCVSFFATFVLFYFIVLWKQ